MPNSILPPLPTATATAPVDHDSLAARQARTAARSDARVVKCQQALLDTVVGSFSDLWGSPLKVKAVDGSLTTDPSQRRNEDNLSPVDVAAAYGTAGVAKLEAYHLIMADAIQLGATDGTHPVTGEDMTTAPAGWTVVPNADGTITVTPPVAPTTSGTAPTPPAPAATPAA